jgi:PadR family transcriptional regulator, regulatory protein AphA
MSTTSSNDLTPTSYAMLGLLALRPWTTYELAKQMQRSVRWFWARAERKLYDEPKHLVACGLATTRSTMTGKRASTVYEITTEGRAAIRDWMAAPEFEPPQFEMEGVIHVFFAENGRPDQLIAAVRRMGAQAVTALAELHLLSAAIAAGDEPFPERRAMNAVTIELWARLHETIRDWSRWAESEVASWPPVRRNRRVVSAGPPERGSELFAAIAERTAQP